MTAKRHKCLELLDVELAKHNTRLASNLLNENDVFVATEHIARLRNGKRPKQVIATFCPFCGKDFKRK